MFVQAGGCVLAELCSGGRLEAGRRSGEANEEQWVPCCKLRPFQHWAILTKFVNDESANSILREKELAGLWPFGKELARRQFRSADRESSF